jgi:hypothetical protein
MDKKDLPHTTNVAVEMNSAGTHRFTSSSSGSGSGPDSKPDKRTMLMRAARKQRRLNWDPVTDSMAQLELKDAMKVIDENSGTVFPTMDPSENIGPGNLLEVTDSENKRIYDCSFCGEILYRTDALLLCPADGQWQGKLFMSCFSCGQCKTIVEQWPAYALDPKLLLSLGSMGHPNTTLRRKCQLVHPRDNWDSVPSERLILTLRRADGARREL